MKRDTSGTSILEFAMSICAVCFLMLWFFEVGMCVYAKNALAQAAQEGIRYAVVHGSNTLNPFCSGPGKAADGAACADSTGSNVAAKVVSYSSLSLRSIPVSDITVSYPDNSNAASERVSVTVAYPYVPWLALPVKPMLTTTVSGRILN